MRTIRRSGEGWSARGASVRIWPFTGRTGTRRREPAGGVAGGVHDDARGDGRARRPGRRRARSRRCRPRARRRPARPAARSAVDEHRRIGLVLVVERDAAADGGAEPGLDRGQVVGVLPVLRPAVAGQRVAHPLARRRGARAAPRRRRSRSGGSRWAARPPPRPRAAKAGQAAADGAQRRVEVALAVVLVLRPGAEHAGRDGRRRLAAVVDERDGGAVGGQPPRGGETPDARTDDGGVDGGGEEVIGHELPTLVRTRSGSAIAGRVPASQPPFVGLPRSWRIVLRSSALREVRRLDRRQTSWSIVAAWSPEQSQGDGAARTMPRPS